MTGRMFPFISATWNPLGGECQHSCTYCWAKQLINKYNMQKYTGPATLNNKEIYRKFQPQDFIFTCDMTDLFGDWVANEQIQAVLNIIEDSPAKFLLLTKNPQRYLEFDLPNNAVAGATIECDMNFQIDGCKAPTPFDRIEAMRKVKHPKMISIEPIMAFTPDFPYMIASIKPEFIAVGFDNYNNDLPEPSLDEAENLIRVAESFGIKAYRKTMREGNKGKVWREGQAILEKLKKESPCNTSYGESGERWERLGLPRFKHGTCQVKLRAVYDISLLIFAASALSYIRRSILFFLCMYDRLVYHRVYTFWRFLYLLFGLVQRRLFFV